MIIDLGSSHRGVNLTGRPNPSRRRGGARPHIKFMRNTNADINAGPHPYPRDQVKWLAVGRGLSP